MPTKTEPLVNIIVSQKSITKSHRCHELAVHQTEHINVKHKHKERYRTRVKVLVKLAIKFCTLFDKSNKNISPFSLARNESFPSGFPRRNKKLGCGELKQGHKYPTTIHDIYDIFRQQNYIDGGGKDEDSISRKLKMITKTKFRLLGFPDHQV